MYNEFMYKLIRSNRKTISVEISSKAEIIVRAPMRMRLGDIDKFVEDHADWIDGHIELQKQRLKAKMPEPSADEVHELKNRAKEYLPKRVEYYSALMGVEPSSVKITSAKNRLGSCSSADGVCFSFRVMQYDDEVIDYVVIHELAHIKEHNHSKRFYTVVEKYCPEYKRIENIIRGRG